MLHKYALLEHAATRHAPRGHPRRLEAASAAFMALARRLSAVVRASPPRQPLQYVVMEADEMCG